MEFCIKSHPLFIDIHAANSIQIDSPSWTNPFSSPDWQSRWEKPRHEGVSKDLLGARPTGRVRVEQSSDKGASRGADVRRDAVFVALDLLISVLQTLSLKGRLPNQKCVAG